MPDAIQDQSPLTPEKVAMLAHALGIPIAPERLPDVTAVLAELFALEAVFADLDLTGVVPDGDAHWPERTR